MKPGKKQNGVFQKVSECLYRYSSNGVYYSRLKRGGKGILKSLNTDDRQLAARRLGIRKQEAQQLNPAKGKLTLGVLGEQYLQTVAHLGKKTVERKRHIVRRLKDFPGGLAVQVGKICQSDVATWLSKYKFGPVSRNQHLAEAKRIFQTAVDDNVIASNPAVGLKPVKLATPIRETPTWEQFQAIVADVRAQEFMADADDSADFLEFQGTCGLGQAEASALRWSDVDFETGKIRTFRHKTKSGFVIPLYPQARALLERRRERAIAAGDGNGHVFKQLTARNALAGACRRLKLPAFTQRALRRCFITRAIQKGISIPVIAQYQGHSDGGKLLLDTYAHVDSGHAWDLAQRLTAEPEISIAPAKTEVAA